MLINVFSLHRTGSTWWSHYIKNQYPGAELLNEIFNQLIYHKRDLNGAWQTAREYSEGWCWHLPNNEYTDIASYYREITPQEEADRFDRWIEFFRLSKKSYVVHTHLTPLQDEKYLTELSEIGDNNYYVYRENKLEQIASCVLVTHTGEYSAFTKDKSNISEKFTYPIIDVKSVEWICYDIARADKLVNEK